MIGTDPAADEARCSVRYRSRGRKRIPEISGGSTAGNGRNIQGSCFSAILTYIVLIATALIRHRCRSIKTLSSSVLFFLGSGFRGFPTEPVKICRPFSVCRTRALDNPRWRMTSTENVASEFMEPIKFASTLRSSRQVALTPER